MNAEAVPVSVLRSDNVRCALDSCFLRPQESKIDRNLTADLTVTTYCQIDSEDFVNFCGLLRKRELY